MNHISVLLKESVDGLKVKEGGVYVDGTLNAGGHTEEILKRVGGKAKVIGIDLDADAMVRAKAKLVQYEGKVHFALMSFRDIDRAVAEAGEAQVDGILLDLGLSSNQLEESSRGFTFQNDEPLLMTFKKDPTDSDVTAKEVVNTWSEESLADIIFGFGEERFARRIARAIVNTRAIKELQTTGDLVRVVESAVPSFYRHGKTHCATKTFQAIRMAVNDEVGALKDVLRKGFALLSPGGRFSIISFHSIEDRIVKRAFQELVKEEKAEFIFKKPLGPGEEEIRENRRSRSAKLRVIEKVA